MRVRDLLPKRGSARRRAHYNAWGGERRRVGVKCQGEVVDVRPYESSIAIVVEGMAGENGELGREESPLTTGNRHQYTIPYQS